MQPMSERDIKEHVISLVRESVRKYSSTAVPTVKEICAGLRLRMEMDGLPQGNDGVLAGNTIIINAHIQSEERKQFTRFHEITHYLIEQDGELISVLHDATWNHTQGYEASLERLCDVGAAEFLMPRDEFKQLYNQKGFHIELVTEASRHFGSSMIATTIQLAQVAPHSCITAVCEYVSSPSSVQSQPTFLTDRDLSSQPQLCVLYSASSPSMKYWLARHTAIPKEHPIHDALRRGECVKGETYVPFRSGKKMPCYCECLPYLSKIYVVFHRDSPPDPRQLEFALG